MPRVSVIIPARNAASTLPDTLASLAAQTFSDWDAIVVDDASTDGTASMARACGERVAVVSNETRLGPAGSRNRAIRDARSELIATLDADDLWRPRYLERQIGLYDRATRERRRVAAVCCDAELLSGAAGDAGNWSDRVRLPEIITLDDLLRENVVYNSVLMSRAAFLEAGGYREDLVWGEDLDLWLRFAERGWEIAVNPEVLAVYRLRPDALSADSVRLSAATRRVYAHALRRGQLTRRQRSVARRQLRLHALIERRAQLSSARADGRPSALAALRLIPLTARVVAEHPERWRLWLRQGPRSAAAGRHAG